MNLHPILPDSELPEALKRSLKFGDPEQIKALNALECRIDEMEIAEKGELKYFKVSVEFIAEYDVDVMAKSKADAEEKAQEQAENDGHYGLDFEITTYAREVNQ